MSQANPWWETLSIQDGCAGRETRQGLKSWKSPLVQFRWITGAGGFTGSSRHMGKTFCQKLITRTLKVIKTPFKGAWDQTSTFPKGSRLMQQGGWRNCIGGITVPSHSSTTSKGSPLVHPLVGWQGLLSCLLTSSSAFSIWAPVLWWNSMALFPKDRGTFFPCLEGESPGAPSPQSKQGGIAQHYTKKAALRLCDTGDTGSSRDWLC